MNIDFPVSTMGPIWSKEEDDDIKPNISTTPESSTLPDLNSDAPQNLLSSETLTVSVLNTDTLHKRPLPPPDSRSTVLRQFEDLDGFESVDRYSEVLVATRKRSRNVFDDMLTDLNQAQPGDTGDSSTYNAILKSLLSHRPQGTNFTPSPRKKQRLCLPATAFQIVEEIRENDVNVCGEVARQRQDEGAASLTNSSDQPEVLDVTKPYRSTAFEDSLEADEGYFTQLSSPTGSYSTEDKDAKQPDSDDALANQLVQIHKSASPMNLRCRDSVIETEWASLAGRKQVELSQQEVQGGAASEARCAAESKKLRERARDLEFCEGDIQTHADCDDSNSAEVELPRSKVDALTSTSFLRDTLNSIDAESFRPKYRQVKSHYGVPAKNDRRRRPSTAPTDVAQPEYGHTGTYRVSQESSPDKEALLDFARDTINPRSRLKSENPYQRRGLPERSADSNPFSRSTAEAYRTQFRHLRRGTPIRSPYAAQVALESRLMAAQTGSSRPLTPPTRSQPHGIPRQFSDFSTGVAGNNGVKPSTHKNEISRRGLQLLAQLRKDKEAENSKLAIPLGEIAPIDFSDAEAVKKERARLKHLKFDLERLRMAFRCLAFFLMARGKFQTGSFQEGTLREIQQMRDELLHKPVAHDIISDRLGKARDAAKRYVPDEFAGLPETRYDAVKDEVILLCGKEEAEQIDSAITKLEASMTSFDQIVRAKEVEAIEMRKQKKRKGPIPRAQQREEARAARSQVQFAAHDQILDENGILRTLKAKKAKKPKRKTRTEVIKEALTLYGEADRQRELAQLSQQGSADSDSEISEEDANEEGYYDAPQRKSLTTFGSQMPPGFIEVPDLAIEDHQEITREEEHCEEPGAAQRASGQAFDQRLAYENELAALGRDESKLTFDDYDLSDSDSDLSDEEEEGDRQAYRYTVCAVFLGVDAYRDHDEYKFQQYINRGNAENRLNYLVCWHQRHFNQQYGQSFSFSSRFESGMLMDQTLMVTEDISVKVWIETKVVDLSKRQARNMRNKLPQNAGYIWRVHWENIVRTLTTTRTATTARPALAAVETSAEAFDDLFDESPPPEASASAKTVTSSTTTENVTTETRLPDPSEPDIYTNPTHANRCAKEVYMDWYASFCPARERPSQSYPEYSGTLGQQERAIRQEVEDVEGVEGAVVGPWELELERPVTVREEVEEGHHGVGGDSNVLRVERVITTKVSEHMTVKVLRNMIKGPIN